MNEGTVNSSMAKGAMDSLLQKAAAMMFSSMRRRWKDLASEAWWTAKASPMMSRIDEPVSSHSKILPMIDRPTTVSIGGVPYGTPHCVGKIR